MRNGRAESSEKGLSSWELYVLIGSPSNEGERVARYGELFSLVKYDIKSRGKRVASFYLREEH